MAERPAVGLRVGSNGGVLRLADLMTDDLGRNSIVSGAELTDLGWRLSVKQAAT